MTQPVDPRFDNPEYIHKPDEMDDDKRNGLVCFLSEDRPCDASCTAWVTFPPKPMKTELNDQSLHCSVLVNLERLGQHFVIVTQMLAKDRQEKRQQTADQKRAAQRPPDSPVGGK
jgi:hypothetical protein